MNAKKKTRISKKWYAAVCGALSVLLLAAMIVCQLLSRVDGDTLSAQVRAGAAAQQVSAQFEQALEDGFRQMRVGSAAVEGGEDVILSMLSSLVENGSFDRAALITGELQQEADGSVHAADPLPGSYIPSKTGDILGKIIVDEGGAIQLRLNVGENMQLAGWLDMDYVEGLLSGAYPEDYGYALYNAATGAYIINKTGSEQERYYDTLLALNKGGRTSRLMLSQQAQAYIEDWEGRNFYIAHETTGVDPWSIALFIPEEILAVSVRPEGMADWLTIGLGVLFAASLIGFILLLSARLREEKARSMLHAQVRNELLHRAAESAGIACFVYSRRRERIIDGFDGLKLADGAVSMESISDLMQAYALDETDAERLYDRMRELRADENAELRIACPQQGGERMLRFDLRCMEENSDYVIASILDCTLESEREDTVKAEESFRRAMQAKASSVWEIDAARNRWRLVSGKIPRGLRAVGLDAKGWRDYTADLNGPMREFMDAGDYDRYADIMSPSGLGGLLRTGKGQLTLECRVHAGEADIYEWYRLELRIYRSAERGDLMANLFVYNVDAAKNADLERQARAKVLQQTLTALGGLYDGLYYVDLDKDICYTAKTFVSGISSKLSREFKGTFDSYIEKHVHPDDQEGLRKLLSAYQLRKYMTEESHLLRREYRRRYGEEYRNSVIILQAARFENGTVRDVVIAMRKHAEISCVP